MKKEDEIPKKPEWVPLREKLDCSNCPKKCEYNRYRHMEPTSLLACKRKGISLIYQGCVNGVSAIPLFFVSRKIFYAFSDKFFFLPLLILLVIVCFYDEIWIFIEKRTVAFFENLEKRRRNKYEAQIKRIEFLEEQKKQKEADAEAKRKVSAEEIKQAKNLYRELKKLQASDAIQGNLSGKYKEMLNALKEVCDDLSPEEFLNNTLKSLIKVYLPEFLKICQNFVTQDSKGILTSQETQLFEKLLGTTKERLVRIRCFMWEQDKTNLRIDMTSLEEVFSISSEKEEAK